MWELLRSYTNLWSSAGPSQKIKSHHGKKRDSSHLKVSESESEVSSPPKRPVFNFRAIRRLSPEDPDSRYIDTKQLPISFTPCKSLSKKDMNDLDYRVVPEPEKVKKKLRKASRLADEYSDGQCPERNGRFARKCGDSFKSLKKKSDTLTRNHTRGPWGSCYQLQTSKTGNRNHVLQDVFTCGKHQHRPKKGSTKTIPYAGIFDGHGPDGEKVALTASMSVMEHISQRADRYAFAEKDDSKTWNDTVLWNAHKVGFVTCDRTLHQPYDQGGTTASVSSFFHRHLWTANTGDSKQILLYPDYSWKALTEAAIPGSRQRKREIKRRGGTVTGNGKRLQSKGDGSLGMARSLGDKKYHGVSNPRPKITKTRKPKQGWNNHFLLMGTDGLWNATSDETICNAIKKMRKKNYSTSKITQILALAARKAGSKDDISVALVDLRYMYEGVCSSVTESVKTPKTRINQRHKKKQKRK